MKKYSILLVLAVLFGCENEKEFDGKSCFSVGKVTGINVNESMAFTNCSEGGDYYLWEFGDGTTSTEKSPSHAYTNAGTYKVILVVQTSEVTDLNADLIINRLDRLESQSAISDTTLTVIDEP